MPYANTQSGGNGAADGAQPSVVTSETGKISGLRVEAFHGSRNPQVYKDWKRSVEAIRYISDLALGKLAVVAYMSLSGEARDLTRHIELSELQDADGGGLKKLYAVLNGGDLIYYDSPHAARADRPWGAQSACGCT